MKNIYYILVACLIAIFYQSCTEEGRLDHMDDSAPAPAIVSGVTVKPIPGGVVIKYKVPLDANLLYVKAEYETSPGTSMEAKSSYYKDSIVVEGFGTIDTRTIKLYSVGKNEKQSEPILLDVQPLTPPIVLTYEKLLMKEAFGGIRINFENKAEANLAIVLMVDTLGGIWQPVQTFYTKAPEGNFSCRGLKPVSAKYAVYVRDRWNNKSDTLVDVLTPILEVEIQKPFLEYPLPSDTYLPVLGWDTYSLKKIWDGDYGSENNNLYASPHDSPMPQHFTVKLPKRAVISRITIHQRTKYEYMGASVKRFELYGSDEVSPGDDLFGGSWTLLGEFQSWKPSGTGATITQEDRFYANVQGESFELVPTVQTPDPWKPMRYIRFRTMETYSGPSTMGQILVAEMEIYGQIQE